jgi:hypothetical protein
VEHAKPAVEALRDLLDAHPEPLSLLLLRHTAEAIEMLQDRIVMGTTIVLGQHMVMDFYKWAKENKREFHAISRSTEPAAVAVIMAN